MKFDTDSTLTEILVICLILLVCILAVGSGWLFLHKGGIKGFFVDGSMMRIPLTLDVETNLTVHVKTISDSEKIQLNMELNTDNSAGTVYIPIQHIVQSSINQTIEGQTTVPLVINVQTNFTNTTS